MREMIAEKGTPLQISKRKQQMHRVKVFLYEHSQHQQEILRRSTSREITLKVLIQDTKITPSL